MKTIGIFLLSITLFVASTSASGQEIKKDTLQTALHSGAQDRAYWVNLLYKIVYPIIHNLSEGTLKKNMPVIESPIYQKSFNSTAVAHLEAVGRTMSGIAPWLSLRDDDTQEGQMRKELRLQLLKGLKNMVDPASPDYLNFRTENQPLVDAAYVAQAFLQAPKQLWDPLDKITKQRFITEFKALRRIKPFYNNWLLFAGLTESFLLSIGEQYDPARIDIAFHKLNEWYVGDGWYKDGETFAMNYYNSFVMHPMLVLMLKNMVAANLASQKDLDIAEKRMIRYSDFLERMISPEGYYPPFGRSITYRVGIFHALAQVALMNKLPNHINPAQVRCGLTKVMHNQFDNAATFDDNGWLQLGFVGHQPTIADTYTCTGSLYICTLGFLDLGLPATHPFWTNPAADWTSKKAWNGEPFQRDYHVDY